MRKQLPLSIGFTILLLGGCATAARPWPAGYREAICAATAHLRAADDALREAAAGIEAADAERVTIAAAGMERESDESLGAINSAPGWEAGARLRLELIDASVTFRRAASEFRIGAGQGDGPALDGAIASAHSADASLGRADLEAERLRTAIGWQAC
jgi:hypothetical protein